VPENRDEDGRLINENVAVLGCENYELFAVGERSLTSLHPVTSICFYIYILIKIRQPSTQISCALTALLPPSKNSRSKRA
jgi:hypothetical protein